MKQTQVYGWKNSCQQDRRLIICLVVFASVALATLSGIVIFYFETVSILLISAGIILLYIVWRKPFRGVLLFAFLIPSEGLTVLSGGATLVRYLGIGITLVWLVQTLIKRRPLIFRKRALPYFFYFAWALLSVFWAPSPDDSQQFASTYSQLALLLVLMLDQIRSYQRLKELIVALATGGVLAVVWFYLFGEFNFKGRLVITSGTTAGVAFYGYPLAFSMTLFGILTILGRGKWRLVGVAGFFAGIFPLIGTGLRGALLATAIGIAMATIVVFGKKKPIIIISVVTIIVLFASINFLSERGIIPATLAERLTISAALDDRGSERLDIWELVLEVAERRPIFGLGLNQFSTYVYNQYLYNTKVGSHNDYLEALVSLGFVGVFILLLGEYLTMAGLLRVRKHIGKQDVIWYGAIVALLSASIIGQNFVNQIMWKYVWVIRAIAIVGSYPEIWCRRTNSVESNDVRMNDRKFVPDAYHDHRN